MDYIDLVYVALKDKEPCKILMSSLKDPAKFIEAVKYLIEGDWLSNVYWDNDYHTMTIQEKIPSKTDVNNSKKPRKTTWYDRQECEVSE